MAMRNLEISRLIETTTRQLRFITFDVSVSGHIIATISGRYEHGRILWSEASIHGFQDFDASDREAIEKKISRSISTAGAPVLQQPERETGSESVDRQTRP